MRQQSRTKVRSPNDANFEKVRFEGVAFAVRVTSRVAAPGPRRRSDQNRGAAKDGQELQGQVG